MIAFPGSVGKTTSFAITVSVVGTAQLRFGDNQSEYKPASASR
jgi:hypothetical protein